MKYNTGRASYQISAKEKFDYGRAFHRDYATDKMKKYYNFLMVKVNEHNIDMSQFRISKLETRKDYAIAIEKIKNHLIREGIIVETEKQKQHWEQIHSKRNKYREEIKNTKWISMKKRLPDRKYVKTLDEDYRMLILEWDAKRKCFLDNFQVPITEKSVNVHRSKLKVPIAWAYLD